MKQKNKKAMSVNPTKGNQSRSLKSTGPKTAEGKASADDARMNELILRGDVAGMHHHRAAKLRTKTNLTEDERAFLKKFDSIQRRIARDPDAVWKQGFDAAHRGLRLLEHLIHEKHLQKLQDTEDPALYNALCAIAGLVTDVRNGLIRYAEGGSKFACHVIFREGKAFANAFSRLAIARPEGFQWIAKRSLTMPSLRALNPAFTCDAEAIAKAIHLAEGHLASNIHDNRSRIGALCHQYMAELVDLIEAARLEVKQRNDAKHRLSQLPELRGNAQTWWKAEIKERVHSEHEKMKKNPYRNPALWQELKKVTNYGTDSAMRAAFDKYCRNKLDQIAGKAPAQV